MAFHLSNPPLPSSLRPPPFSSISSPPSQSPSLPFSNLSRSSKYHHITRIQQQTHVFCSSSQTQFPSPPFPPPSSREEAILQAKTCLSSALRKPLNNPTLRLKKQRQSRLRVEIPIVDDSPDSLSRLSFELFSDLLLPITRRGQRPPCLLLLWPDDALRRSAHHVFDESPDPKINPTVVNAELGSVDTEDLRTSDVIVFMSPEPTSLDRLKTICFDDAVYPRPVVLFNPKWAFEDENAFSGTFEVVYSFLGLEVKGIFSRRKGVVFKYGAAKSGGEEWSVFVEDDDSNSELKMVSKFKKRPAIGDVESVLYNLMAANSPVTRSVKFIRQMGSKLTSRGKGSD